MANPGVKCNVANCTSK